MKVLSYSDINKEDSTLRPYQQKAKKDIFDSWDEKDNVMFQMPTGTGKTRLFTSIIRDINDYSKKVKEPVKILIIAHRTELIDQIDESLNKYGVPHNVIAGGRERNYKYPVNVASIQTITHPNNLAAAKKLKVQFIIIDEAHHALASSYKKLWDMYPDSKKLGVTATPWRMNHQSFLDLFETLVMSMPIKDFIKQGFLSPYKYFSLRSDSDIQKTIDGIELDRFGEYSEASMEDKMDIGSIRAQLLDSYQSLAEGKKGIIYAINIAHAKHISKEYEAAGYVTACIDSKTPAAERKELVNNFRKGKIDIIVNVDIFSEGFDCPDIEFIQLARPTRSLVKYLQQVGRGLRPTENKEHCIILDNVGMYSRFGLPDARRHWNYHFMGHKVDEEPPKKGSKGNGKHREIDMSEGTEDMELIQDSVEDVETYENNYTEQTTNETEQFDPIGLLEANNFQCENFIFYFTKSKVIYETYIQDDKYFIISELNIDEAQNTVHRKRVGKIPSDSWMFWQMLREKIDNLRSIVHYGANYTVFKYRVISSGGEEKDKFFDYKGREISTPDIVIDKFEQERKKGEVKGYIDVPVSKAYFRAALEGNKYVIYKTIQGVERLVASMPFGCALAKTYPISVKYAKIGNEIVDFSTKAQRYLDVRERIVRTDETSITVRKVEDGKAYLLKYSLDGKLIKKGTIASTHPVEQNGTIPYHDTVKLMCVFDSKATSYKYFWFMSLLQIYKETENTSIPFKQILVRMIINAWRYVFVEEGEFRSIDQLPSYLETIQNKLYLDRYSSGQKIEDDISENYSSLESLLTPLLKNVPYRFLSPWITFTSNDDVKEKSAGSDNKCLYALFDDHITIKDYWKKYLLDHYDQLSLFIEMSLKSHLKLYTSSDTYANFYKKSHRTLSNLINEIQTRKGIPEMRLFCMKYDLPLNRKLVPSDIIERIPEGNYTLDKHGNKQLNVSEGDWSLKTIEKLILGN